MKYSNYLKNKNLSKSTITIYLSQYENWKNYLDGKNPNKTLFTKFINNFAKHHQPNSVHLVYSAILSIFKFEKRWKLLNQCRDIRLPKIQQSNRSIITLEEFNFVKDTIELKTKLDKRNWLIFSFLFFTGMRVSELLDFNKNKIYENNKIKIKGKGNKIRVIFLTLYLQELLKNWKPNRIAVSLSNKLITIKQINQIVKRISKKHFGKLITPHGLRRSFATNLLKNNANIEIVRKTLGHTNINTTARYLYFNEDDMFQEINSIMNKKNN